VPFLRKHADLLAFGRFVADGCCAAAASLFATYITMPPDGSVTFGAHFYKYLPFLVVFLLIWGVAATEQRLFSSRRGDPLPAILASVAKVLVFSLFFSGFVMVFVPRYQTEREYLVYFCAATLFNILMFRLILRLFLWSIRQRGYNYQQVLLVGANPRTEPLVETLLRGTRYGYQIIGVLDDDAQRAKGLEKFGIPYLGDFQALEQLLVENVVDEVYISLPVRSHYETIVSIAHLCEGVGVPVRVRLLADLFPVHIASSHFLLLEGVPILSISPIPEAYLQLFFKRVLDFTVATLGLIILAPLLFLPVAIAIKLESKGPVLFNQLRVGVNGRLFKMLKFRSMVENAEAQREELEQLNEADWPVFKIRNDPRITRAGRFIRRYSIDEFPQLVNVWLGQMSLVGPRPPIPGEVDSYTWDQRRRLSVKPGMTGLWQVSGRSDVSFQEWVEMDLEYIDDWSLWLDLRILLKTVFAVIEGQGAS